MHASVGKIIRARIYVRYNIDCFYTCVYSVSFVFSLTPRAAGCLFFLLLVVRWYFPCNLHFYFLTFDSIFIRRHQSMQRGKRRKKRTQRKTNSQTKSISTYFIEFEVQVDLRHNVESMECGFREALPPLATWRYLYQCDKWVNSNAWDIFQNKYIFETFEISFENSLWLFCLPILFVFIFIDVACDASKLIFSARGNLSKCPVFLWN